MHDRAAAVVALERLLIGGGFVSKSSRNSSRRPFVGEQFAVVMTDLMPKVPEHRTVRLVHALPQRLAMGVVALGEIKGDEPVLITGDDLAVST
jgi:hypothetical protein